MAKRQTHRKYRQPGAVYAIRLADRGFAFGRIIYLSEFMGPLMAFYDARSIKGEFDQDALCAAKQLFYTYVDVDPIFRGRWHYVGVWLEGFDPVSPPPLVHQASKRIVRGETEEERASPEDIRRYPIYEIASFGAVESRLADILSPSPPR